MNLNIKNKENPFEDFLRIASQLMNDKLLIVGKNHYRFTSIEFYYFEKDSHADIYSHRHEKQETTGQWYFHSSGLDITFGSEKVFGGILIRGIENLKTAKYINGPILVVQELFSNLGSIDDNKEFSFFISEIPVGTMSSIEKEEIYYSRRVGLNQKIDKSENGRFYNGLYRFFINPKQTQKDKGIIAVDLLAQGKSEKEINDLFGYQHFNNNK